MQLLFVEMFDSMGTISATLSRANIKVGTPEGDKILNNAMVSSHRCVAKERRARRSRPYYLPRPMLTPHPNPSEPRRLWPRHRQRDRQQLGCVHSWRSSNGARHGIVEPHIAETRRQLPVLDLAVTVFVESLTGIEQGARTGLASCFTGAW
jgi:hypothetical protein